MIKKTIILYCLILSCCMLSCQDEPIEQNFDNTAYDSKNGKIINGRFYFSSKESLKKMISDLKEMDENNLDQKFKKLYLKGFRSHSPIGNPKDNELVNLLEKEYKQKIAYAKSDNIDENYLDDDVTISDPFFASIMNENNEIIIHDSIYKITTELGVLSARLKDTTYLYNYINKNSLAVQTIKTKKNSLTSRVSPTTTDNPLIGSACEIRSAIGGRINIDNRLTRYIAPYDPAECNFNLPSTSSPSKPYVAQLTADQILQNRINSLPDCQAKRTSFFQNLFGTNKSCITYFDSKHRIKNEFWNQKWGFYSSVGIQTRVQVKKLWIWWASDADELYLGINKIYMRYNYPAPKITYLNTFYSNPEIPVYMYKGEFKVQQYNGALKNAPFIVANSGLPFFGFGSDVLNIYIRKLPYLDKYDIKSESNIKALYKLGIDFLRSKTNNNGNDEFVVSYQKNSTEIEVIYFGQRFRKTNSNSIKKTLYKDTEFVVSATYNSTPYDPKSSTPYGDWKYTVKAPDVSNTRKYTYIELDMFGMGRRGDTWSGSRMYMN